MRPDPRRMERPSPPPLSWEPARVRRTDPRRARIAIRAAILLAMVPLAFELGVSFAVPPPPAWLVTAASWGRLAYLGAAVCAGLAVFLARGVKREGAVAVEARSLFVAEGALQRRIPRRTIEAVAVRPRGTSTVEIHLENGRIHRLQMRDREKARRLAEVLAPPPPRRAAPSPGPARSR